MSPRHFLTVDALSTGELGEVLDLAAAYKAGRSTARPLQGRCVGLLFEKPSTRTRVSFEVGVHQLGGYPLVLTRNDLQLGRGEPVADTARILSGYLDMLVMRTFGHDRLETMAAAGSIPVVNALSDAAHPCQALADLLTLREHKGALAGTRLAYVGDGNNVAHSLLRGGALAGLHVTVASPPDYAPDPVVVDAARALGQRTGGTVTVTTDPAAAVAAADAVYTDVWASMGQEDEAAARLAAFDGFRVDGALMAHAGPDAIVLHCLPAHRGEEIAADVLDGPQSVVWQQAENRLHAQKALLAFLLRG